MQQTLTQIRADLEKALPPLIAREAIAKYTGNLYSSKTMSVYDSIGKGIPNPVRLGRKIAYTKENLINWLISRLEETGYDKA